MSTILSLNHVAFTVEGQDILTDISVNFTDHERTSVEGGSGSGKSTLLKLMAGLNPSSQGSIEYKGQDIHSYEYYKYRQQVSYVYQTPSLFGETVEDNLAFPSQIRKDSFNTKKARAFMDALGLEDMPFDKEVNALSGGEKQRVSLIRHFMYPPQLLLLDEITASLDEKASKNIWSWIFDQADQHQISLVWISHKTDEQDLAERNIFIEDGQIMKDDRGGRA